MNQNVAVQRQSIVILQFVLMGLIWGSSFLFMKGALTGVSFGQLAWSREILGALTLGVIMLLLKQRLPRERVVYLHFIVIALTNAVIPHLLFAWAEQYVSSSLGAIYNSLTPIATALFATLLFRVEILRRSQVFGIAAGVVGVLVIIGPWQYAALTGSLEGQIACILAATSYGFAIGYMRRFISHRPIAGTTVGFLNVATSGTIMLLLTPVLALGPVHVDWVVAGSILLLGCLGTGVAYLWSVNVLRAWGPTGQSTVTYVIPVVGVVLGVLVLGERLSWNEPVGAAVVLVGILLTQGRLLRASRTSATSDRVPGALEGRFENLSDQRSVPEALEGRFENLSEQRSVPEALEGPLENLSEQRSVPEALEGRFENLSDR